MLALVCLPYPKRRGIEMHLTNSFSINMINPGILGEKLYISIVMVETQTAKWFAAQTWCRSVVGHEDTARAASLQLEVPVAFNRETIRMNKNESVLVCQYHGPRLEEGATSLPEGASLGYYLVKLLDI